MDLGERKPLYLRRDLLNAPAIERWARQAGFTAVVPASQLHVTICYSRAPVNWAALEPLATDSLTLPPGTAYAVAQYRGGVVVLELRSDSLARRHEETDAAGAVWDWPGYIPHITVASSAGSVEVHHVQVYGGPVVLGPEVAREISCPRGQPSG